MSNQTAWERWELGSFDEGTKSAQSREVAAEEVKLPTVEEIEQIRAQAREEGRREGLDEGQREGHSQGYAEGQAKVRDEASRLAAAADRLERAMSSIDSQVAKEVLALAIEIGRQVVRGELSAHPEALLHVVRDALTHLPHQHSAIYLNPDDASLLRSHLGDQLGHAGHRINEDPQLKRGDCVIEAGGSRLDGTVAMRWHRVVEALDLNAPWHVAEKELE